jgi:serine/threonine protein kinase
MKAALYLKKVKFEDKYLLDKKLGSGSFASVYQCKAKEAEANEASLRMKPRLAVKVFDKSNTRSMFRTESKIWKSMAPHENCVTMLEAFEDDWYFYIVMEKCGVSLSEALQWHARKRIDPKEQDIKHTFKGLLSGVNHLHECDIVHRDVKPENILLAKGHTWYGQPLVKLCDMGFGAKISGSGSLSEVCGTAPYMAPEMLLLKGYDTRVDVWSCGVLAYLMILDAPPYGEGCFNKKEVKKMIRTGKVLPTFKAHNNSKQPSGEAVQFLASLLNRDPDERPSAKSALTLSYLDSSTPTSLKLHSAQSKKWQKERRHNSIIIEALCLELPFSIDCDDGSDAKAPTCAVAHDVMKTPSSEAHDVVRKVDDELKSPPPSCSTKDDEDGVESVVSNESCNYNVMFSEAEPLADVIPSFKPALSCIRL